jgi:outer membrane protein
MNGYLRRCALGIFLAGLGVCAQARAQEFRAGYVNIERILKEATPAAAAQTRLAQEFSKREKDIADQGAALKSLADKFQIDAPILSSEQRASRQKKVVDLERELQRATRSFQEDLAARKNEELQRVLERANTVVKQIAETENYDVVLQDAVYASSKLDITDKVIKALNAENSK